MPTDQTIEYIIDRKLGYFFCSTLLDLPLEKLETLTCDASFKEIGHNLFKKIALNSFTDNHNPNRAIAIIKSSFYQKYGHKTFHRPIFRVDELNSDNKLSPSIIQTYKKITTMHINALKLYLDKTIARPFAETILKQNINSEDLAIFLKRVDNEATESYNKAVILLNQSCFYPQGINIAKYCFIEDKNRFLAWKLCVASGLILDLGSIYLLPQFFRKKKINFEFKNFIKQQVIGILKSKMNLILKVLTNIRNGVNEDNHTYASILLSSSRLSTMEVNALGEECKEDIKVYFFILEEREKYKTTLERLMVVIDSRITSESDTSRLKAFVQRELTNIEGPITIELSRLFKNIYLHQNIYFALEEIKKENTTDKTMAPEENKFITELQIIYKDLSHIMLNITPKAKNREADFLKIEPRNGLYTIANIRKYTKHIKEKYLVKLDNIKKKLSNLQNQLAHFKNGDGFFNTNTITGKSRAKLLIDLLQTIVSNSADELTLISKKLTDNLQEFVKNTNLIINIIPKQAKRTFSETSSTQNSMMQPNSLSNNSLPQEENDTPKAKRVKLSSPRK